MDKIVRQEMDLLSIPTYSRASLISTAKRTFSKLELIQALRGGRLESRPASRNNPAERISVSFADGRQFCFICWQAEGRLDIRILVRSDELGIHTVDVLRSILEQ